MAEDPFEAALNAMGDGDDNGDTPKSADDPFEAALETLEQESGDLADGAGAGESAGAALEGTDSPSEAGDASADPFEAAMAAMGDGGAAGGGDAASDPFEAAMAVMGDGEGSAEASTETAADPFDSALQVAKAEHHVAPTSESNIEYNIDVDFLMDIKLEVTFEVGRAKMFISDLLSLGQGSVIELHRLVGEELEIFVNGHLFATGEVVVVNEKFGARITQIIAPEKRIQRLGTHAIM